MTARSNIQVCDDADKCAMMLICVWCAQEAETKAKAVAEASKKAEDDAAALKVRVCESARKHAQRQRKIDCMSILMQAGGVEGWTCAYTHICC